MGKITSLKRKRYPRYVDPVADQLPTFDAKTMLVSNMISMGWRLAIMVLLPIFIGVQIDKKLDSSPSVTLAAFFIAIFGAGMLIYKTFTDMNANVELDDKKEASIQKQTKEKMND